VRSNAGNQAGALRRWPGGGARADYLGSAWSGAVLSGLFVA